VVEAIVDNRDRRLLPGQYVTMAFVTGERAEAITVPRGAVARLGGAAKVWVVSEGRVEPREVTTGLEGNERMEIVRGLTGSERVVARGQEGLYAGARVREATSTTPPAGHPGHGSVSGGSEAGGNAPVPPSKPDQMKPAPKDGGHGWH
jgi:hypothetical protein